MQYVFHFRSASNGVISNNFSVIVRQEWDCEDLLALRLSSSCRSMLWRILFIKDSGSVANEINDSYRFRRSFSGVLTKGSPQRPYSYIFIDERAWFASVSRSGGSPTSACCINPWI